MRFVLALCFGLVATSAYAQCSSCSGGICTVPVATVASPVQEYNWRTIKEYPDQVALYKGDRQIGAFNYTTGKYAPFVGGQWLDSCSCPCNPPGFSVRATKAPKCSNPDCDCDPCDCPPGQCNCEQKASQPLTGVITARIEHGCTSINGCPCPQARAFEAIGSALPDDSGKCHVTVISTNDVLRNQILSEIKANPSVNNLLVQDYNPAVAEGSWPLACGFKLPTQGEATIYAQAPSGKVLWRTETNDSPADKQRIQVAIRNTNPNYDPKKDPDLNPAKDPAPTPPVPTPAPTPAPDSTLPPWAFYALLAGSLGAVVLFSKKGSS